MGAEPSRLPSSTVTEVGANLRVVMNLLPEPLIQRHPAMMKRWFERVVTPVHGSSDIPEGQDSII